MTSTTKRKIAQELSRMLRDEAAEQSEMFKEVWENCTDKELREGSRFLRHLAALVAEEGDG